MAADPEVDVALAELDARLAIVEEDRERWQNTLPLDEAQIERAQERAAESATRLTASAIKAAGTLLAPVVGVLR